MSTPEKPRPSLDDTLARIDQALAEPEPPHRVVHIDPAQPSTVFEAAVVRDGNTFTINQPGVYEMTWNPGATGESSVVERALERASEPAPYPDWVTFEKPGHLSGAPGPTCPGCAADAARPGWLARALNRLFGDGAS